MSLIIKQVWKQGQAKIIIESNKESLKQSYQISCAKTKVLGANEMLPVPAGFLTWVKSEDGISYHTGFPSLSTP